MPFCFAWFLFSSAVAAAEPRPREASSRAGAPTGTDEAGHRDQAGAEGLPRDTHLGHTEDTGRPRVGVIRCRWAERGVREWYRAAESLFVMCRVYPRTHVLHSLSNMFR